MANIVANANMPADHFVFVAAEELPLKKVNRVIRKLERGPRLGLETHINQLAAFCLQLCQPPGRLAKLARRLGYDDPPESELPDEIDAWRRACTYLTHHAAATCTEKDPHCGVCPLRPDCPYGQDH